MQSEFELDRNDYLDTIRRQNQQIKLLQQILDKVEHFVNNLSIGTKMNIEDMRKEAVWDEDTQKWIFSDNQDRQSQSSGGSKSKLPQSSGLRGKYFIHNCCFH